MGPRPRRQAGASQKVLPGSGVQLLSQPLLIISEDQCAERDEKGVKHFHTDRRDHSHLSSTLSDV
jgi:hypothetical protein